ncbi:MAG: SHOCT domain-containing protein [Nitrosopumilus sp. H8]|nr:MAG: SHOCT domain-containing protein [Nitrosopumilus sp. H8]
METQGRHIERLLKKADAALQDGIKKADRVLDEATALGAITAKQAARTSRGIHARAKKERDSLKSRSMGNISRGVSAAKKMASSTQDDLEILERLGMLRKNKVITEKEFQAKKKKILGRI